jgi:hypothetical protein
VPDPQLADFGTTAHLRSDFGALSPFLLPTFLNLSALPIQSLKRLFNTLQRVASVIFLFASPLYPQLDFADVQSRTDSGG